MTVRVWVELSGENPALADAELDAVVGRLGGQTVPSAAEAPGGWRAADLPDLDAAGELGRTLALARRLAVPWVERGYDELTSRFRREGRGGKSAAFRSISSPRAPDLDPPWRDVAAAYVTAGGRIDLDRPDRRFRVGTDARGDPFVAEELSPVDRRSFSDRRMPNLPFQRPVSLPPRLGRVAVNLARVGAGGRIVDPFVGTGALLLEAALLGIRVSGVDRDPLMIRGALRNFASSGVSADALRVADAAESFRPVPGGLWDAVVTDPPYGRASGSGGEAPARLLARVLPRWADLVRPDGRIVVIVPGGDDPVDPPWKRELVVRDRVHRSLTREFRVYRRSPAR